SGSITDSTLIVRPDVAEAQRRSDLAERDVQVAPRPGDPEDHDSPETTGSHPDVPPAGPTPRSRPKPDYFFGSTELSATAYALDFKKVVDEVIQHLASAPGVNLTVKLEIEADAPDGFSEGHVRTVTENARVLK